MVPFCYLVLFLVSGKLTGYSLSVWLYVDLANYLNLSALAYVDFKDPSNPLRSWKAPFVMYLFGYKAYGKMKAEH